MTLTAKKTAADYSLQNSVDALLGPESAASQGMVYNPLQHDYAKRVASALESGNTPPTIAMIEAETGTGKTLGYLVPLFLFSAYTGERVMVSTFTRHLQRQMMKKDALLAQQWVASHTGKALDIKRRIGRAGYFDATRCARLAQATEDAAIKVFLEDALNWLGAPQSTGVIDDYLAHAGLLQLPDGLPRVLISLDSRSADDDSRAHQRDVEKSQQADVIVVNHALLCLNTITRYMILDDERPSRALVVDEADQLATAACSVLSESLSIAALKRRVTHAFEHGCLDAIAAKEAATLLSDLQEAALNFRYAPISRLAPHISESVKRLAGYLRAARPILESRRESNRIGAEVSAELLADAVRMEAFARAIDSPGGASGSLLASWSPVKTLPTLTLGDPEAGRVMGHLWGHESPLNAAVLTSATLAVPGKPLPNAMDATMRKIGMIRHCNAQGGMIHNVPTELMHRYQQQRFGSMQFVLADRRIVSPTLKLPDDSIITHPDWLDYCARMVKAAHNAGGRTLVLAKSWRDTDELVARLHDAGLDAIAHVPGQPIAAALAAYRANDQAIFVSPSAWEGVDLPGMVDQLVITRTPTPPPDSDENLRLRLHLREGGMKEKAINSILRSRDTDVARNKMRQGFGRGIRQSSDATTVWLADPRIAAPVHWRDSLDAAASEAQTRQSTAMHAAIPARFLRAFDAADVLCDDSGRLTPEAL